MAGRASTQGAPTFEKKVSGASFHAFETERHRPTPNKVFVITVVDVGRSMGVYR